MGLLELVLEKLNIKYQRNEHDIVNKKYCQRKTKKRKQKEKKEQPWIEKN